MCPEVEKGHTEASWSTGLGWKLGVVVTIRALKLERHLNFGDNFCQIQSPGAVSNLFPEYSKVSLSESSVGRLLRQLGFSCQKPLYRAYQQNPEVVEQWKNTVFPEIKKRAKKLGTSIYFEDESGIRSDLHAGTTWAPVGKTPVI